MAEENLPTPEQAESERVEFGRKLDELSEMYTKAMKEVEEHQEAYWNSLTMEQQIDLFCCVSRRIYKGEIEEQRSYRGVLYTTFGFDTSAYGLAQNARYLEIHNAIMSPGEEERLLIEFAKAAGIRATPEQVKNFLRSGEFKQDPNEQQP